MKFFDFAQNDNVLDLVIWVRMRAGRSAATPLQRPVSRMRFLRSTVNVLRFALGVGRSITPRRARAANRYSPACSRAYRRIVATCPSAKR